MHGAGADPQRIGDLEDAVTLAKLSLRLAPKATSQRTLREVGLVARADVLYAMFRANRVTSHCRKAASYFAMRSA